MVLLIPSDYTPNTCSMPAMQIKSSWRRSSRNSKTHGKIGTASARDRTHATPPSNALPLLREDPSGTPPLPKETPSSKRPPSVRTSAPLYREGPLEVRPSAPRCECFLRVAISTSPALRQTTTVWRPLPGLPPTPKRTLQTLQLEPSCEWR